MLKILIYPNKLLETRAEEVTVFDEDLLNLCNALKETATAYNAEGLAATQTGVLKRVFVVKDYKTGEYVACVNPEVISVGTSVIASKEGCLSFPGVHEIVYREEAVVVSYKTETGELVTKDLFGIEAVAFAHELDHLNGIVFLDYMGNMQKRLAIKKLEKTKRKSKQQERNIARIIKNFKLPETVVVDKQNNTIHYDEID